MRNTIYNEIIKTNLLNGDFDIIGDKFSCNIAECYKCRLKEACPVAHVSAAGKIAFHEIKEECPEYFI
jgi:hypothetical protein